MLDERPRRGSAALLIGAVVAYAVCRLALLPAGDIDRGGAEHDGAYIALLADNLRQGHGYVNDSLWLVFLRPERLPMPFHNANPLYPTLIAAASALTGANTITSGFAVSALSSVLLFAALLALLGRYVPSPARRFLLALGGTVFAPVIHSSFVIMPDELCVALTVAFLACVVCPPAWWSAALGGVFLGLAWLTRSSAILVVPAVALYLLMAHGWRKCLTTGVIVAAVAGLTASPWLLHTAAVWGNPLRSDSSYYLLQDYHARGFRGTDASAAFGAYERFVHSPEEPPSLGDILRREPASFLSFVAKSFPRALFNVACGWSYDSRWLAALLGALTLASVWWLLTGEDTNRKTRAPEIAAVLAYAVTAALVFGIRGFTMETRYLVLAAVFLGLLLTEGWLRAVDGLWSPRRLTRLLSGAVLVVGVLLWSGLIYQTFKAYERYTGVDTERQAYFAKARDVHREFGATGPIVVGNYPYFYTIATGAPALSITQSDDAFLMSYMKQYHAHYVFLTSYELKFWRPRWREPAGRPPQVILVRDLGTAVVFEVKDYP